MEVIGGIVLFVGLLILGMVIWACVNGSIDNFKKLTRLKDEQKRITMEAGEVNKIDENRLNKIFDEGISYSNELIKILEVIKSNDADEELIVEVGKNIVIKANEKYHKLSNIYHIR